MRVRKLAVEGALEFTPRVFEDARGLFVSPFQGPAFRDAYGAPLFPVGQTNHSQSRRGVVRGIHYTLTPPGMAKYVYCAHGAALDIVVDIRVGSPTFGRWDAVRMDQRDFRSMYFPVGVGHAFVALTDHTTMAYMVSGSYVAEHELAVSITDPELGITLPDGLDVILSERDAAADTLAEAKAKGLLPDYAECQEIERKLQIGLA